MQPTVLKYTLLLVGATLGTFAVALLGAYMLLPSIAPNAVGTAADSLSASGPDTTRTASAPDTTRSRAVRDTTAEQAAADSTAKQARMIQRLRDSLTVVGRLQDSLRTLQKQLRATEQEAATLQTRVSSLEGREAKVSELKDALLDMGQRELATVLANVDMPVLGELYQRTSGRSRTQLLRAMSAERTAQFVNEVVGANENAAPDDTSGADSTRGRR